ncbi:MAG: phosphoglycerate kinase [Elusimicrobia bacterium]|nr:phosphoglycerate kinase [Elusimicrobiota bacterium]MBR3653962.1 phosphoglycerate kinase [Elusimicrobiota bacterium]
MLNKKTVDDLKDIAGKKVLVRCDFNVPLKQGVIQNYKRIDAALPTIKKLLEQKAKVILCSHMGKPKGEPLPELSLAPVAVALSERLGVTVKFADDPKVTSDSTKQMAKDLKEGEVLLLQNTRYRKEETKLEKDETAIKFAEELAALCDNEIFVNDAFGTAHRAHCSNVGVTKFVKESAAGYLVEKEIKFLGDALNSPVKPFLAILGGAKVSDKINVIENLLGKVDAIIIGGAMAYTFLKAQGYKTGKSLVEEDKLDLAKSLLKKAEDKGVKFLLPIDHVIATAVDFEKKEVPAGATVKNTDGLDIEDGFMGVDAGPKSIAKFSEIVKSAKTIVWNGPLGIFEVPEFSKGTVEIAKLVAEATDKGAISVVGGGDSVSAVKKAGVDKRISHVSTGGGASLEFLEGKDLPGIAALPTK